ncbi:MAG: VWA domain-containing protein [Myxococcales bacterium]|nr:VWA domain-containing protein [Myxococcales bacterium]
MLGACGDPSGREDDGQGSGVGLPTGTGTGTESADGATDDEKLDVALDRDMPGGEEECAAVSEDADLVPLPADIIFVVDNSGSMSFEAAEIQARMNDFSSQIIASGIDVHVVLISSYPDNGNGICIDPPLGSGGCPGTDDNPPTFTHVDERVASHDAWERLLATYDQWAPTIRAESSKHIVVVTDDTSNMDWMDFDAQFLALDPSYAGYIHHSVVCHSNCASAAGIGTNYIDLSNATMGVAADLCDQDFQAVFDVLSTEVIGGTELACEFEIPPPPDDMEFNPDQVNVEFNDGMGNVLEIGRVDGAADCPNVTDGWYYDDPMNPQMILVCPQTCDKMQGALNGAISIAFGCATMPAG